MFIAKTVEGTTFKGEKACTGVWIELILVELACSERIAFFLTLDTFDLHVVHNIFDIFCSDVIFFYGSGFTCFKVNFRKRREILSFFTTSHIAEVKVYSSRESWFNDFRCCTIWRNPAPLFVTEWRWVVTNTEWFIACIVRFALRFTEIFFVLVDITFCICPFNHAIVSILITLCWKVVLLETFTVLKRPSINLFFRLICHSVIN